MNELGKKLRIAGKSLLVNFALLDVAYPKETLALLESGRIQAKIPSGISFLLLFSVCLNNCWGQCRSVKQKTGGQKHM